MARTALCRELLDPALREQQRTRRRTIDLIVQDSLACRDLAEKRGLAGFAAGPDSETRFA